MKFSLKKVLVNGIMLFTTTLFSMTTHALLPASSYNKVVFFGDSLTDNGNLYRNLFKMLPKSPPYFEGRFSNGRVWSEYVADYLKDEANVRSSNFALGGETVLMEDREFTMIPYDLSTSVQTYLAENALTDKSKVLFIFWIGENDYMKGAEDARAHADQVVDGLNDQIEKLISKGAKNFVVVNLPDITRSPYGLTTSVELSMQIKTMLAEHNARLTDMVAHIQGSYKLVNISMFDAANVFDKLIGDPSYFNKKYNININVMNKSCFDGSFTGRSMLPVREFVVEQQLADQIKTQSPAMSKLDTQAYARFITSSPDLRETYLNGMSVNETTPVCSNPDEYVFWDRIHPTAVVHKVMGSEMIEFIAKG